MNSPLCLLQGFGVEIEYMIVDSGTLAVRPVADQLIHKSGKHRKNEVSMGNFKWSNELVSHVIEIKTAGPVASLANLAQGFQQQVQLIEVLLEPMGCRLLPSGMHPWMDPNTETVLWPHDDKEIYETFDRVFGCKGHGWSNLQSTHINLSFHGDEEFRKLHSAIRLVLPLIPALAASSPFMDGGSTDSFDNRLLAYKNNCARFPSISGGLIPDVLTSQAEYETNVYARILDDLLSVQADEILEPVWVNARGAIARFDRGSIEIRLMDTQECPIVDLEIVSFVVYLLNTLVKQQQATLSQQEAIATEWLIDLLGRTITEAGEASHLDDVYLKCFGIPPGKARTVNDLLLRICEEGELDFPIIRSILKKGSLSQRLLRTTGAKPDRNALRAAYLDLADCLRNGKLFDA